MVNIDSSTTVVTSKTSTVMDITTVDEAMLTTPHQQVQGSTSRETTTSYLQPTTEKSLTTGNYVVILILIPFKILVFCVMLHAAYDWLPKLGTHSCVGVNNSISYRNQACNHSKPSD